MFGARALRELVYVCVNPRFPREPIVSAGLEPLTDPRNSQRGIRKGPPNRPKVFRIQDAQELLIETNVFFFLLETVQTPIVSMTAST